MNLVKSIFILLAPVVLLFIVLQAILGITHSSDFAIHLGVLMSALPLLLFLGFILLFKKLARTNPHLPWISVPSFVGYCIVLFVFIKTSDIQLVNSMVYSLSAFFITFLYIYWYSNNRRKLAESLVNNQKLPEFNMKDFKGNEICSNKFIGKNTLIFFFRGNWCPLCVAQIDEFVRFYKKFEERNINVIFISPQSVKHTESLAKKYDLSFEFYTDKNNQAAKQLGISHKFGLPMGFQALGYESDSVYPTIIATNNKGVIIYNDQTTNYRVRPEPKELLAIFE